MAKSHRDRTRRAKPQTFASTPQVLRSVPTPLPIHKYQEALDYYDRRTFRPDRTTRAPSSGPQFAARIVSTAITVRRRQRRFHGIIASYTDPLYHPKRYLRQRLGFSIPRRLEVCIRRKVRKEVIFAKRKAGKGGQRKPIRNFWSAISCKR